MMALCVGCSHTPFQFMWRGFHPCLVVALVMESEGYTKELMSLLLLTSTIPKGAQRGVYKSGKRHQKPMQPHSSMNFQTLELHTVNIWLKAPCFGVAFSQPAHTNAAAA